MILPRPTIVGEDLGMVFNRDPLGIASSVCVYILLAFGDYAIVYYVLEYGKHEGYVGLDGRERDSSSN